MSTLIEALRGLTFTEDIDDDEMVADQETGRESFTLANSKGIPTRRERVLFVAWIALCLGVGYWLHNGIYA